MAEQHIDNPHTPLEPFVVGQKTQTKEGYIEVTLKTPTFIEMADVLVYANEYAKGEGKKGNKQVFSHKPDDDWLAFWLNVHTTANEFAKNNKEEIFGNKFLQNEVIDENMQKVVAIAKVDKVTGTVYRRNMNWKMSTDRRRKSDVKFVDTANKDLPIRDYLGRDFICDALLEIGPIWVMASGKWGIQVILRKAVIKEKKKEYEFKKLVTVMPPLDQAMPQAQQQPPGRGGGGAGGAEEGGERNPKRPRSE